jgi:CheY-like chemotaxis protein
VPLAYTWTRSEPLRILSADHLKDADCLVLDVHLRDLNGLELQAKLTELVLESPIVFITARGDIPMSVRAMKAGALEFLTKPFDDQQFSVAGRPFGKSRTPTGRMGRMRSGASTTARRKRASHCYTALRTWRKCGTRSSAQCSAILSSRTQSKLDGYEARSVVRSSVHAMQARRTNSCRTLRLAYGSVFN